MSWLILMLCTPAGAQDLAVPQLDAQLFHQSIDSHRTLWTDLAGSRVDGFYGTARLGFNYVNQPFVVLWSENDGPTERTALVQDAAQFSVLGGVAYDRFRLGVDVPIYVASSGDLSAGGAGLGDVRLDLRGTALDRNTAPLGLGFAFKIGLPTSTLAVPLGADGLAYEVSALVDKEVGPVLLAANLGHRGTPKTEMPNVVWGDQVIYRVGAGVPFTDHNGLSLDFSGAFTYASFAQGPSTPLEALLGGWQRVWQDLFLQAGVGTGLTVGIGSPRYRVLAALAYQPPMEFNPDTDGDGLVDKVDHCIDDPEDFDSFQDEDGCPDLDNDQDGLVDVEDPCPDDPEDMDSWEDEDGCPDPSREVVVKVVDPDNNRIATAEAMLTATDLDIEVKPGTGTQIHPGRYTVSAMADGYGPASMPLVVELGDRIQEATVVLTPVTPVGTLKVRVVDPSDRPLAGRVSIDGGTFMEAGQGQLEAMMAAGDHEVRADADGFAPALMNVEIERNATTTVKLMLQPSKASIAGDRIDIRESVFFDTGKATIKPVSFALLDEVAVILRDHPEVEILRIEGHTDSRGSASSNQALSQRRAASVMQYLIDRGIVPARLNSVGLGETVPLDPREVPEAWEKNRRVDFFIEKRADD